MLTGRSSNSVPGIRIAIGTDDTLQALLCHGDRCDITGIIAHGCGVTGITGLMSQPTGITCAKSQPTGIAV